MFKSLSFVGYWQKVTLSLWAIAYVCFYLSDTEIISVDPWSELQRMGSGLMSPDFFATEYLLEALWQTVSFALLGVFVGLLWGAPLALVYTNRFIAALCAVIRSIHEIFWALLFLQIFGLSPITGILAIALPYGATFARVFHDILLQSPVTTVQTLPTNTDKISRYFYGRISQVIVPILAYIRYRFECALRSSAVLGFIGMPTLGFYLETAFRQGNYPEGAALLILFIALIGSISLWCRPGLIIVYLLCALFTLPSIPSVDGMLIWRFISQDVLPPALQHIDGITHFDLARVTELMSWSHQILLEQALPGVIVTLLLALSALAMSHIVSLFASALSFKPLTGGLFTGLMKLFLLILRSIPEYIFAFIFMMMLGPSMLPAMLALALHNGALIAFLSARQSDTVSVSTGFNGRFDGYCYDILPKIYPNLMGLLCYRFEVILRETAIFGILGVATLGFYIDSAFAEIRYSTALLLMGCTALLNIVVDVVSRRLLSRSTREGLACR